MQLFRSAQLVIGPPGHPRLKGVARPASANSRLSHPGVLEDVLSKSVGIENGIFGDGTGSRLCAQRIGSHAGPIFAGGGGGGTNGGGGDGVGCRSVGASVGIDSAGGDGARHAGSVKREAMARRHLSLDEVVGGGKEEQDGGLGGLRQLCPIGRR